MDQKVMMTKITRQHESKVELFLRVPKYLQLLKYPYITRCLMSNLRVKIVK
jgi:hypothetical protein